MIIVSGAVHGEEVARATGASFLAKPYAGSDLVRVVATAIEAHTTA